MLPDLDATFPRYTDFSPTVPVWCLTPGCDCTIHRFFDTSPISPSGRYAALTRLPFEDRLPRPGDIAEVVLVDLTTAELRVVAETRGWDTQLGAQVQWGPTDACLFFNDLDPGDWRPFGVVLNPLTGERRQLDGTVYMASPDGRWAASPCLRRTAIVQAGYGVVVPPDRIPRNDGASPDDGLYLTDTSTGKSRLLLSFRRILDTATFPMPRDAYLAGDFYGFHVKWSPDGQRLAFVVRWIPRDGGKASSDLITMKADGSDVHVAIPSSEWSGKGGHHPNWCPDGERLMMNLNLAGQGMRLVSARYDASEYGPLHPTLVGSGHPSLHPDGRHVITDSYPGEPVAFGDGTVPIRLLDLATGSDTTLARVRSVPPFTGPRQELRVDPHPAWDFSFTRVAFNACPDGTRRVYLADLSEVLKA